MLVVVPLVGAVVTKNDLTASRRVEMAAVAGDTTGEVHALLLLLPPLVLLMSSQGGNSKASKEASSSQYSERHF